MIGFINGHINHKKKRRLLILKLFFVAISFVVFGYSGVFAAQNIVRENECTTTNPTTPCIIYEPNTWTSGNVTAILTGLGDKIITNNGESNIFEFLGNGSFTFNYKEKPGSIRSTPITATVNWIDREGPTGCSLIYSTKGEDYFGGCSRQQYNDCINGSLINGLTTWFTHYILRTDTSCIKNCSNNNTTEYDGEFTDENVTVTLTGCEDSGHITILNNQGTGVYVFTGNGTFIFELQDEAGNQTQVMAKVTKIHKTELDCNIDFSTRSLTNQNVIATLTGCKDGATGLYENSFIFTGNGVHEFLLASGSDKTGSVFASVNWIDKEKPTCTGSYSPQEETFGDVLVKLTGCNESLYNSQTLFLFKKNGTHVFEFQDQAGNTGSYVANVNRIKENIFITGISHEITGETIKLMWESIPTNLIDMDILVRDDNYETYQILGTINTQEKEFSFESIQESGHFIRFMPTNGGKAVNYFASNDKEDKPIITPKCDIKYDIESNTNNDVTAELTNCNEDISVTNNGRSLLHIFTENDNFTFEFEDDYGNTGEATASVSWIDKMAPSCTVEYSTQEETISNVIAMLTGCSETVYLLTGDNSHTFAENGSYPFIFFDNAGNRGIAMANVNRIKSEGNPTTILTGISHIVLDGQITLFWTKLIDDSTQISYKHNSGDYENLTTINSRNEFYSFESEGEGDYEIKFEFKGYDDILYTFTIDPEPDPTCTISYSTTDWINGSVVATLSCNRDVNIVGNSGNNKITFENNGSYTFRYTYGDGKIGEKTATVTRIDKKAPICGLWTYNKKTITNNDVIVTLSRSSDDGAGINMSGGTCIITGNNKSCTIEISDNAGNTGICSSQIITWIDKDAPVLSEVIAVPSYISGHTPSYTFSSNETGIINYYGGCSGNITNTISGENTITFHKLPNGNYDTCKITITDAAGNTGELNISPFKINDKSPVCDIEYSTKDWTSGDVIANLVRCTEGATGFNETGFEFTGNGEFEFTFVSEAGVQGSKTATVTNIDKIGPNCTRGGPSKSVLKGGDTGEVILTCIDTGAGIVKSTSTISYENDLYEISQKNLIINGNENKYIFEFTAKEGVNGTTGLFLAENAIIDNVGNDATFNNKSLIVDNTAPTCVISGINDNRVNHEILLEIMMYDTNVNNSGYSRDGIGYNNIKTKMAYKNGIHTGYVKDLAGNEGYCTGSVTSIDKTKPVCGNRSYSTQDTTSGDVTVTLSNSTDTSAGINVSGGTCTITGNNQSCNIEISDNACNTEICTSEIVTRIDKQAPSLVEIIPVPEVTASTTPKYTFYTDEAGEIIYNGYCIGNMNYANTGNNTIQFNELTEGTYDNCSIIVTDSVGNINEALQISAFEINTAAPTCNVEYDSSRTGGTVEVILTGCSERATGFNETGHIFQENGSFTFTFRSEATDVSGYVTVNINNIDKEPPVCGNWSYNPISGSWTNGIVTGFLRNSYDTGAGISQAEWSCAITNNNQSCNVEITDKVGNAAICTSDEIRWIDNIAPSLNSSVSINTPTSDHYIEYSFNSSEDGEITYSGNCSSSTKYANSGDNTITFHYLEDEEYDNCKIAVTDIAGNQSYWLDIPAFKINSAVPTCNVEYSTSARTSGTVKAILTGCTEGATGFNETGYTFTGNGIFTFTFISETGIPGQAKAIVKNIDTTKPICGNWSYSPTEGSRTSGTIIATLSNSTDNLAGIKISGGNCEITGNNTTCSIEISDMVGNSKTCISDSVRWIDNTKPKISEIVPINTPSAKKTPELYLRSDKSGTLLYSGVCEPQDTEVNIGNNSITLKELNDGTYDNCEFAVVDYLGNQSDWLKISGFQINTKAPVCTGIIYSNTGLTNQNVIVSLTGCDENILWMEEKEHTFYNNGSFTFIFRNNLGITGSKTVYVDNIDKTAPECEVMYTPATTTSGNVIARLTGCNETINKGNISHTFTENGTYTFTFHDLAGNTGSKGASVNWIHKQQVPIEPQEPQEEKIIPICSIEYSTKEATVDNVIARLTGCNVEITGTELQYTFTGNGTHTFTFTSLSGVSGAATAYVDWIIQGHGAANQEDFGCKLNFDIYDNKLIKTSLTGCKDGTKVLNNNGYFYHIFDTTETSFDFILMDKDETIGSYPTKKRFFEDFNKMDTNEYGDYWYIREDKLNMDKYLILEGAKNQTKYYTISGINLSGNNATIFESDIYCDLPNWDYLFVEISTGGSFSEIGSITNVYNDVFSFELGDNYSYDNISIRFSVQSNNDNLEGYCKIDNVLLANKLKMSTSTIKPSNTKNEYTNYKVKIKGLREGEIIPIGLIYNNIAENYQNCTNNSTLQKLGSGDIILYKNGDEVTTFSTFAQNGDQFTVKVKSLYQYFGSNSIDIALGKTQKSSIYNIPILQKDIYNNILYDEERYDAYEYAYCYGLTSKGSITQANMNGNITRAELAKMISNYAINILGHKPNTAIQINFTDVSNNMDNQYDNGITKAYQLGLMGQNMPNKKFRPYDNVTRAEFATTLSRLLYDTPDGTTTYYSTHINKLKKEGIISTTNPKLVEKRGYVMLMLMRTYKDNK